MFDQSGASSAQRGRMGAPWSMRLWVCAALHVDVHDRTGRSVTLPTTLGDIERWIWPNGWPRANRKRDWPVFRQRLIHLGTIRPRIIGRDGTAYLIRVVDAPAVPEEWDRTKPCPLVVSIPAAAAAGAAVNWPALLRYGADSPGMFRAYLATVAVLDYSARKGQSITRDIPAVVLAEDGKPKRGKGGKLKRNPAVRVENPAARFVGSLGDEELRQMLGLPDHREYRARRCIGYRPDSCRVEGRRVTGRESVACPALSQPGRRPIPVGTFPPPALRTRRADFRHRALQWNHAARTRVPGHGERTGASCGTQLAPVRRTGRCVVRPVYALATATARVVPFACACDDVRHSCSSAGY